MIYPLKLIAPLKEYIWGGTRLKGEYGKVTSLDKVAESWELSCHKDGSSVIENGEYSGQTLLEYIKARGKSVLGTHCAAFEQFPVLIKLIDAHDNLSVQVHPNNDYALRVEGEYGKTEMWYIVDCEEDASLIYGFNRTITKEEFASRIADNTLLEVTNSVPVKKGDVFFIEAGTLHAIGKGILIAEIQQNSNTTYRVYDYGRVGADNKPRELHIEKALDVTSLSPTVERANTGDPAILASCEYFTVKKLEVNGTQTLSADEASFHALLCIDGAVSLESANGNISLQKGETLFLDAGYGKYALTGNAQILLTTV